MKRLPSFGQEWTSVLPWTPSSPLHRLLRLLLCSVGTLSSQALHFLLRRPDIQWSHAERRDDATVLPGFDSGLDDVTMHYAARALIEFSGVTDLHYVAPELLPRGLIRRLMKNKT